MADFLNLNPMDRALFYGQAMILTTRIETEKGPAEITPGLLVETEDGLVGVIQKLCGSISDGVQNVILRTMEGSILIPKDAISRVEGM